MNVVKFIAMVSVVIFCAVIVIDFIIQVTDCRANNGVPVRAAFGGIECIKSSK